MNLPKKIKIGYKTYKVKTVKSIAGCTAVGEIHLTKGTIEVVDTDCSKEEIQNTLLHEVLHGIWKTQALDFPQAVEEEVISNLTNGLLQVLQDNPEFAKLITR